MTASNRRMRNAHRRCLLIFRRNPTSASSTTIPAAVISIPDPSEPVSYRPTTGASMMRHRRWRMRRQWLLTKTIWLLNLLLLLLAYYNLGKSILNYNLFCSYFSNRSNYSTQLKSNWLIQILIGPVEFAHFFFYHSPTPSFILMHLHFQTNLSKFEPRLIMKCIQIIIKALSLSHYPKILPSSR